MLVAWIAVHEEVLGGKLRGFRKKVSCSEAEALGILTVLWIWARKNADITGLLSNADRGDIENAIRSSISSSLDVKKVTDALIEFGWIDEVEGALYVHDWYEWQQYWYNYLDKKEKDKLRKRLERERNRAASPDEKADDEKNEAAEEAPPPNEEKPLKEKPKKIEKVKYADNVKMRAEEYEKLVEAYGEEFTAKLIEKLDNYKASSGKTYKEDYRAILNWVVEEVEKRYAHLKKPQEQHGQDGGNPFASYKKGD